MRWLALALCFLWPLSAWAGKGVGEDAAYAREQGQTKRFFYVASGNGAGQIEYICSCFPGTGGCGDTSAARWQITRFTYDSSNRNSTIAFAGSDDAYTNVCDNRATLTYN